MENFGSWKKVNKVNNKKLLKTLNASTCKTDKCWAVSKIFTESFFTGGKWGVEVLLSKNFKSMLSPIHSKMTRSIRINDAQLQLLSDKAQYDHSMVSLISILSFPIMYSHLHFVVQTFSKESSSLSRKLIKTINLFVLKQSMVFISSNVLEIICKVYF